MYIPYSDQDVNTIAERTNQRGFNGQQFDVTPTQVRSQLEADHLAGNRARNEKYQARSDARRNDIRNQGVKETVNTGSGGVIRDWSFPDRPLATNADGSQEQQYASAYWPGRRDGGFEPMNLDPETNQAAKEGATAAVRGHSRVNTDLATNLRNGANGGFVRMNNNIGANYTGAGISPADLHARNLDLADATKARLGGNRISREERMQNAANQTQVDVARAGAQGPVASDHGVYDPATGRYHADPAIPFGSGHGAVDPSSGFQPYGPDQKGPAYKNDFSGADHPAAIAELFKTSGMDITGFYEKALDASGNEYDVLSREGETFIQMYDLSRTLPGMQNKTPKQIAEFLISGYQDKSTDAKTKKAEKPSKKDDAAAKWRNKKA